MSKSSIFRLASICSDGGALKYYHFKTKEALFARLAKLDTKLSSYTKVVRDPDYEKEPAILYRCQYYDPKKEVSPWGQSYESDQYGGIVWEIVEIPLEEE